MRYEYYVKANKLIVRVLIVLGFGGAVGLVGCSASRAQKNRPSESVTAADSVVVRDGDVPVHVMPPFRFDPNRPIRRRVVVDTPK